MKKLPESVFLQVAAGMAYPVRAWWFIQQHHLWRLAVWPVAINMLLIAGLALWGWYEAWPWLQLAGDHLQAMAGDAQVISTAVTVLVYVLWLIVLPIAWIVSVVLVILIGHVVASPWIEILSERVECLVLARQPAPFGLRRTFDSITLALGDAVWGIAYLLIIYVPLIFLSLVPGVGAVVSIICGALLLAHEFVGLSMARYLVSYRARWRLIMRNKWMCGGFGFAAALSWLLPGLNLILLPLLAVGGTLLYCDLLQAGRMHEYERQLGAGSDIGTRS